VTNILLVKLNAISLFLLSIFFSQSLLYANYPYNDQVPIDLWRSLEPYFLPENHSIKTKLDHLFKKRITSSKRSFEQAGFKSIKERKPTNIIIGRHPSLKGYILKLFLDTQPSLPEWKNWLARIEGARVVKEVIKANKLTHFDVPKKWIYPLPQTPLSAGELNRKQFILVVEDMNLMSWTENKRAYREKINSKRLTELFFLLSKCGLLDSVYIDNIPFNKKGKICFIDIEHYHKWPVPYERLTGAFSAKMQAHWNKMIVQSKKRD